MKYILINDGKFPKIPKKHWDTLMRKNRSRKRVSCPVWSMYRFTNSSKTVILQSVPRISITLPMLTSLPSAGEQQICIAVQYHTERVQRTRAEHCTVIVLPTV